MRTITVDLGARSYPVHVGEGVLDSLGALLRARGLADPVLLVFEPRAGALYAPAAERSLREAGYSVLTAVLPEGEKAKTIEAAASLVDRMIAEALPRQTSVVALGGGALCDAAGFVAAIYHRGLAHALVPTTLLAQVDASVGGKTALDRGPAKNVIGVFHQPRLVVSDARVLATLSEVEYRSGLAEVVKHGIIGDASLFLFLEAHVAELSAREPSALTEAIASSVAVKARVVHEDETDRGARAALNFGHTFGHALESAESFGGRRHGEAVSVGMAAACRLSVGAGLLAATDAARIEALLVALGLPVRAPDVRAEEVLARLPFDKKGDVGGPRFVLTAGIGDARLGARIPRQLLEEVAREFFHQAGA